MTESLRLYIHQDMPDQISDEVKHERVNKVLALEHELKNNKG